MLTSQYVNTPLKELVSLAEADKSSLAWALVEKYSEVECLEDCKTEAYEEGHEEGYRVGFDDGHEEGYQEGWEATKGEFDLPKGATA